MFNFNQIKWIWFFLFPKQIFWKNAMTRRDHGHSSTFHAIATKFVYCWNRMKFISCPLSFKQIWYFFSNKIWILKLWKLWETPRENVFPHYGIDFQNNFTLVQSTFTKFWCLQYDPIESLGLTILCRKRWFKNLQYDIHLKKKSLKRLFFPFILFLVFKSNDNRSAVKGNFFDGRFPEDILNKSCFKKGLKRWFNSSKWSKSILYQNPLRLVRNAVA